MGFLCLGVYVMATESKLEDVNVLEQRLREEVTEPLTPETMREIRKLFLISCIGHDDDSLRRIEDYLNEHYGSEKDE